MRLSILILTIVLFNCTIKNKGSKIFGDLIDKQDVIIILSNYQLDSVPKEISLLKNAKTLTILPDSTKGWTIYPPLSALDQRISYPPFTKLPDEITELRNLTGLSLMGLNLKVLPDDFKKLDNLEMLDLTMNKLTISNEITKLKGLRKLKYLRLAGNLVQPADIQELKKENPNLKIESLLE